MLEWEEARMQTIRHGIFQDETKTILYGCQMGMDTITKQILSIIDPLNLEPIPEDPIDGVVRDISILLPDSSRTNRERLEAFVHSMYVKMKYKYEPFEWLYQGLYPILKSNVLNTKKGTPAALSLCLSALGEKVGLMLLPMPDFRIDTTDITSKEFYSSYIDSLPLESAIRLKSKTQSVIPEPNTWFLRLDDGTDTDPLYVNCKSGVVMDSSDLMEKNPLLANMSLNEWREQSILRTWAGLVDLAVQAHQRRGESDLVAHWIYVKLALDPLATEWERAITPPELGAI
jgi:hypothetical protein